MAEPAFERIPGNVPGTRQVIEMVATKFNIYFLFAMSMLSAFLFISGLVEVGSKCELSAAVPDEVIPIVLGVIGFSLFFPWFTAILFARDLLIAVKRLEAEVAELKRTQGQPPAGS